LSFQLADVSKTEGEEENREWTRMNANKNKKIREEETSADYLWCRESASGFLLRSLGGCGLGVLVSGEVVCFGVVLTTSASFAPQSRGFGRG